MIVVDPLFNAEGLYHGQKAGHARYVGAKNGNLWCHMVSTLPGEDGRRELDEMAVRIGLKTSWRDRDHYDLTPGKRIAAIRAGAREITKAQSVEITRWQRFGAPLPEWAHEMQPKLI